MSQIPAALRQVVRERANRRCEYCRRPDWYTRKIHHVDHIVALKHGGTSSLSNLAYACAYCNTWKGSNIAAYDETSGRYVPLFNPRKQNWKRHFEMVEAVIIGKTAAGRVTVNVLKMNDSKQVDTRRTLMESGLWE